MLTHLSKPGVAPPVQGCSLPKHCYTKRDVANTWSNGQSQLAFSQMRSRFCHLLSHFHQNVVQATSFWLLLCVLVQPRKKLHQIGVSLQDASIDLFLQWAHREGHNDLVLLVGSQVSQGLDFGMLNKPWRASLGPDPCFSAAYKAQSWLAVLCIALRQG